MRKEIEWIIEFTYALNCTEVLKAVEFICRKRPDFSSIPRACRLFFMGFCVSETTNACDEGENLTNKTSLQLAQCVKFTWIFLQSNSGDRTQV